MNILLRTLTEAPLVIVDGREHRLGPRNLALLARLRYADHPVPKPELGAWFWPKRQFRGNLSTALKTLRDLLSDSVIPLNDDPIGLGQKIPADTDLVEDARARPTEEAVRRAFEAYSAPFLWGIEHKLAGTPELVAWILGLRERFDQALTEAAELRCGAAAAMGAWKEVEEIITRAEACRLASETLDGWKDQLVAARQPLVKSRRHLPKLAAWGGAASIIVVLLALVLQPRKASHGVASPDPVCKAGKARAHLARKEYQPDVNVPLRPGRSYTPRWVLRNDGNCRWGKGYKLRRTAILGAHALSSDSSTIDIIQEVPPGDTIILAHTVIGPPTPGNYGEDWRLIDDSGRTVPVDGELVLRERFQVLPPIVQACTPDNVRARYLAASHPRATEVEAGERLVITWTIANSGTCIWQPGHVALRFSGRMGTRLSDPTLNEILLEEAIHPGDAYTFELPVQTPPAAGPAREQWIVWTAVAGSPRRDTLSLDLVVVAPGTQGNARYAVPECAVGQETLGWIRSERVQDNAVVAAGETLRKAWTVRNEGDCQWAPGSLTLRFVSGRETLERIATPVTIDRGVPPGGTYTFSIPLYVPPGAPIYEEHWEVVNRAGARVRVGRTLTLFTIMRVRSRD